MNFGKSGKSLGAVLIASAALGAIWPASGSTDEPIAKANDVGATYRVPYRLTDTNHALVRVRINGKGPFNMIVDTGAPALFISTEAAAKAGLTPSKEDFWSPVGRVEFEGGPRLENMKGRIEDIFQLVGMNALGLPGARIDGVLGFTVLARFRIEYDLTKDRMTWTRLDFNPKEPFVPPNHRKEDVPAEVRGMDALGGFAKLAALLVGKQPEERLVLRGRIGVELAPPAIAENGKENAQGVRVVAVLDATPAAKSGVKPGDVIVRFNDRDVNDLRSLRRAGELVKSGDRVSIRVRRGDQTLDLTLETDAGL